MHPAIMRQLAADHTREMHATAEDERLARQARWARRRAPSTRPGLPVSGTLSYDDPRLDPGQRPAMPGQVAQRDAGGGLAGALGRDEPPEQRGHRRALVGEDPHIALRAGEQDGLGEGRDRACSIAGGGQGQRPQRTGLDEAAGPGLSPRRAAGPAGPAPGRAGPGRAGPGPAPGARTRGRTAARRPGAGRSPAGNGPRRAGCPGPQTGPRAGTGFSKPAPGHVPARSSPQCPGRITGGLPDHRQGGQAAGQRGGVDELAAQRDALGRVPQGEVELVPLAADLGQPHATRSGHGSGSRT